jgi:hypothetical protein
VKRHLQDQDEHERFAAMERGSERSSMELPPENSRHRFLAQRQRAEVSLMLNPEAGFKAKAEITNGGLLSIAALVSSILLSTTVLVHVAIRDGKRRRL